MSRPAFPLSALVGQEPMRLGLLLAALSPPLGGVLIRGHKGTAKSTVARALAALLPEIDVVVGCRFACDPDAPACPDCRGRARLERARRRPSMCTLPLGITEDRLLGTLDLEAALQRGERRFEPGLLARVHRGLLYVDEVNLLEDHVVDLLLDSAAMGENVVEREGVSFAHPAEFVLVGTMNPEEGELRPQLLDRFGLCADVESVVDPAARAEIVARRLAYERDPAAFAARFAGEEEELARRLADGRRRLPDVAAPPALVDAAVRVALAVGVDGHRADLVSVKAAVALAALEARDEATAADLERVAPLVYAHRVRRQPFEERALDPAELARTVRAVAAEVDPKKSTASPGR